MTVECVLEMGDTVEDKSHSIQIFSSANLGFWGGEGYPQCSLGYAYVVGSQSIRYDSFSATVFRRILSLTSLSNNWSVSGKAAGKTNTECFYFVIFLLLLLPFESDTFHQVLYDGRKARKESVTVDAREGRGLWRGLPSPVLGAEGVLRATFLNVCMCNSVQFDAFWG